MNSTLDIAPDHPAFAGHFPSFPVLPGAVLLDAALAAIRSARGIDLANWQISSAKFLAAVRPGDVLALEHETSGLETIFFKIRSLECTVAAGTLTRCAQGSAP